MKHTLSCDSLGADAMGMGGAIRSRRPMSGMDFATLKAKWDAAPCEWRIASAVGAFWLVRKLLA
jgi:hypothetical protein